MARGLANSSDGPFPIVAARRRGALLATLGALALVSHAAVAAAAPIELVTQRGEHWVFDDVDGSVENADWFSREGFLAGYQHVEDGLLAVHPDDSQLIVIYTTWSLPGGIGAFFQSMANDVHGVGFEHIAPEDPVIPEAYYDDTPNSQVYGFLHMNRWTQYLGSDPGGTDDTVISLIFGQEFEHAWGSFVYYSQDGGPWATNLLGRANAHWSFYVDSGGSPMQGHEWVDNGDGTFTAHKTDLYVYSDLDLYLMGLMPAEDVQPWFVLEDPYDCFDAATGDGVCAPPEAFQFEAETYTVGATRRDVEIGDVIAVEGPRSPAFPEAQREFDVSFLLIKRPDEHLDAEELAAIDVIVARSIELFEVQTRGLGRVVNRTHSDDPPPPPPPEDTGGADETGEPADGSGGGEPGTGSGGASEGADGASSSATGGAGEADGEGGCACTSAAGHGSTAWAGLLVLGAVARRSRRPRRARP